MPKGTEDFIALGREPVSANVRIGLLVERFFNVSTKFDYPLNLSLNLLVYYPQFLKT